LAGRKAKERVEGNGREEMKKCEGQEKNQEGERWQKRKRAVVIAMK
jgi:hypothetical protein